MDCSRRLKHNCRDRDMPYTPTGGCMSQRRIDGHNSGAKAMTTNQTIDGVSRVDLESICEHFEFGRHWHAMQGVQKLRALLDAPAKSDYLQSCEAAHNALKAAQPQGEPIYQVMYRGDGGGGWSDAEKDSYDMKVPHPKHWRTRTVYAEQTAPVAADLTDEQILEAMRPAIYAADGGYVFDTAPEKVIAAGRSLLALAMQGGKS